MWKVVVIACVRILSYLNPLVACHACDIFHTFSPCQLLHNKYPRLCLSGRQTTMFCKEKRRELFEIDAKWHIKIIVRMVMNVLCMMSIVCAVLTLLKSNSKFTPKPFLQAKVVLAYIPCVRSDRMTWFDIGSNIVYRTPLLSLGT